MAKDGQRKRKPRPEDRALVIRRRILDRDHRKLKVPMAPTEIRAASRRMGAVMRQIAQEEATFEQVKQDHKARITALEKERDELGIVLDTETAERDVECVTEVNWDEGTAETRRTDTNEIIARRELTPAERQREMFAKEHVGRPPKGKPKPEPTDETHGPDGGDAPEAPPA